jgi:hypothetical protein
VLAFSFALASRSARSLSVLASVASNTALDSAVAAAEHRIRTRLGVSFAHTSANRRLQFSLSTK